MTLRDTVHRIRQQNNLQEEELVMMFRPCANSRAPRPRREGSPQISGYYFQRHRAVAATLATLVVLATAASLGNGQARNESPLELEYHLRLLRPTTHLVEVEIDARAVHEAALDFVMPAWSPGRYAIYDFAKNVQEFQATGGQGRPLDWTKIDKQTWRVETQTAGGEARIHYKVFANDLNGSFSQFDASHANLNGASIYMYIAGHKPDPIALTVQTPAAWKVVSGFSLSTDQRSFEAPSYDRLIDTPMEISPEIAISEFQEGGKTFRVAVHAFPEQSDAQPQPAPAMMKKLTTGLEAIVHSEMAMMPAPDFDHYTFIFHFAPDIAEGDGMEHLNSTQIIMGGAFKDDILPETFEDAAHEFFHIWNVKRLRPAALGPFDYRREDYSPSLWFAEGITTYYSYVHLLRGGLWSREEFLTRFADEIRDLQLEPGRKLMSAESSSFNAWFYDRSPQMQETNFANTTISYYNKGALIGLLLDLEIRSRTDGQKSLDDVLRYLYHRFYEAPAATSYGPGRGYTESDLLNALNVVSGSDFRDFFERYVRGTEPLPYASVLALAGLALRAQSAPDAPPSLGILPRQEERGVRIVSVIPGGAADRAGLSRDDLLLEVDQLSVASTSLRELLKMYPPGAQVPFTVERHGLEQRITVTLDPPIKDQYSIEELPGATAGQIKLRNAWLGNTRN